VRFADINGEELHLFVVFFIKNVEITVPLTYGGQVKLPKIIATGFSPLKSERRIGFSPLELLSSKSGAGSPTRGALDQLSSARR